VGSIVLKEKYDLTFLSATIPPSQIVVAIIVSVIVGILAGIIPAYRGARMDPVEALRAE
jgi:ABC-type antimicrobial peptide transport system permease subunit